MQRFLLPFGQWGDRREASHGLFTGGNLLGATKRFLAPTKTNFGAMLGRGLLKCWRCVKCLDSSRDDDDVGGDEDLGA